MKYVLDYHAYINEGKLYQGKLNPTFWKDDEFDQDVRTKLLQIAHDFYKDLKVECPIVDIHLTGSLANFNWTKQSDLDVHVLMDFSKVNADVELVKRALDGQRYIWNKRHPVVIEGHDVELYAQDVNEPHVASGLYSLMKGEWITKPRFDPPSIDPKDVSRKVTAYVSEMEDIQKDLKKADPNEAREIQDRIAALKQKVVKTRSEGLTKNGEFSIENLVFKKLRNNGWLEKLMKLGADAYSHIYSEPNDVKLKKPVNEMEVGNYGLVLVKGLEHQGSTYLFMFNIDWSKNEGNRTTVGLSNPRVVYDNSGRLMLKPVKLSSMEMIDVVGLREPKVVLNSKTGKTPLWHEAHQYNDPNLLLKNLESKIRSIPDVDLVY